MFFLPLKQNRSILFRCIAPKGAITLTLSSEGIKEINYDLPDDSLHLGFRSLRFLFHVFFSVVFERSVFSVYLDRY